MQFDIRSIPSALARWGSGHPGRKISMGVLALVLLLTSTSVASIYYGMNLYKSRRAETLDVFLENVVATRFSVVPQWIRGLLFARPERLNIEMKPKHFAALAYKRDQALQRGILINQANEYVPAVIRHGDEAIDVKLRLKGDWTDHLLGDKWSFRVKVKGGSTLFGMKQLSLHHPRARNFAYEWLFHRALEREDILSLRYDFVDVTLNGKSLGVYALEEHFEKRLIENRQRREGPILKLNENLLWADRAAQPRSIGESPTGIQSEHNAHVDLFNGGALRHPAFFQRFQLAHHLLESFRYGELAAHEVFDVERMATYFALCDLLGSTHAAIWHNLRFYFNPVTARLEPIGFDANPGGKIQYPLGANRDWMNAHEKYKDRLFSDPVFAAAYGQALERVSADGYLETLLEDTREPLQEQLTLLYREFPWFHYSDAVFRRNREVIRSALNPIKGLHAYSYAHSDSSLRLELGNLQGLPVQVESVVYRDSLVLTPREPLILPPKVPATSVSYRVADFALPTNLARSVPLDHHLRVEYRLLGVSMGLSAEVFAWTRMSDLIARTDFLRQGTNVGAFDFLLVDEEQKRITIRPGRWNIEESVIVPAGYVVVCGQGTELVLGDGVTLLSYSRMLFQGTEDSPVVIRSRGSLGQGLVVLNVGETSVFEHVSFLGLTNPSRFGWELTGAVTFYEAPVHFSNCLFSENISEDALNVIRADFALENCVISRTSSDALDVDFGNGRITNTLFVHCGNDAIDISGSVVDVTDTRIEDVGDKGLSAGENSQLTAQNVELTRVAIGVASKDLSEVRIDGIRMLDGEVGMTLFQKKPEFGPARMTIQNLEMDGVQISHLLEAGSRLSVNGSRVKPNRDKVKEELYGVRFGKSSRR
jgi:hypothetical protein